MCDLLAPLHLSTSGPSRGPLQLGWWGLFWLVEPFVAHFYSSWETHELQSIHLQNSSSRHSLHVGEMLLHVPPADWSLYSFLEIQTEPTEKQYFTFVQQRHFYFNVSIFCHFKLQSGSKSRNFCLTTPRHLHLDWFPGSLTSTSRTCMIDRHPHTSRSSLDVRSRFKFLLPRSLPFGHHHCRFISSHDPFLLLLSPL